MKILNLFENNVLVQLPEKKKYTASGLEIPDTVKESRYTTGRVLKVGPGRTTQAGIRIPTTLSQGDIILFDVRRARTELDERQVIIAEDDIFCIVEDAEENPDVQDTNTDLSAYLNK